MSLAIQYQDDLIEEQYRSSFFLKYYPSLKDILTRTEMHVYSCLQFRTVELKKSIFADPLIVIAKKSASCIRTVSRAIKKLDQLGFIYVKRRKKKGINKTNIYMVLELNQVPKMGFAANTSMALAEKTRGQNVLPSKTLSKKVLSTNNKGFVKMDEKEKEAPPIDRHCQQEVVSLPKKKSDTEKTRVQQQAKPINPLRPLTDEDREYAERTKGWDGKTTDGVYMRFIAFNRTHQYHHADWSAIWRKWVDREHVHSYITEDGAFDSPYATYAANTSTPTPRTQPYTQPKQFESIALQPIARVPDGRPFWEDPFYAKPARTLEKNPDGTYKMDD